MKLADRSALVTGGGSGIGRAIAIAFAAEGARLIVAGRTAATLDATLAALPAERSGALALTVDVANSASVQAMFARIEREIGGLDILVNNAGIGIEDLGRFNATVAARGKEAAAGGPIATQWNVTQEMADDEWRRMLAAHLDGTFFCTREALKLMSRQNSGAIVNLSSVAALMGLDTVPHYSAAKGGILALTRAVAREVASRGIRVNAICPGYIDTPMTAPISELSRKALLSRTPMGRVGQPREIAATALFLASDESSFTTGQWLSPNGGLFIG